MKGSADAEVVAERIRRRVQEMPMIISGMRIGLTVSLGVAAVDTEVSIPDDLIERADAALYRSKSGGRNLVSTHTGPVPERERGENVDTLSDALRRHTPSAASSSLQKLAPESAWLRSSAATVLVLPRIRLRVCVCERKSWACRFCCAVPMPDWAAMVLQVVAG